MYDPYFKGNSYLITTYYLEMRQSRNYKIGTVTRRVPALLLNLSIWGVEFPRSHLSAAEQ